MKPIRCTGSSFCTFPQSAIRAPRRLTRLALAVLAGLGLSAMAHAEIQSAVVTTTEDIVDPNDNLISLREAISYAPFVAFPAPPVTFAPSLAGKTIELSLVDDSTFGPSAIRIPTNRTTTIDGGTGGVTIKPKAGADHLRMFYVQQNATLSLRSVTLAGGRARGFDGDQGGASAGLGGAIANAGLLTLNKVTFTGNSATGGDAMGTALRGGAGLTGPGNTQDGGGPNPGHGLNGVADNGGFGSGGGYGSGGAPGLGGNGGFGSGAGAGENFGGKGGFGGGGGGFAGAAPGAGGFGGGVGGSVSGGGGAGFGGAVFNYGGVVSGTNVTFSANRAVGGRSVRGGNGQGLGGAIFNLNGRVLLKQATLANNVAPQGGGAIFNLGDNGISTTFGPGLPSQTASVTLNLCILAGSNDGGATPLPVSDMAQAANDSTQGAGGVGAFASAGQANILQTRAPGDFGGTALTADPRLTPLGNYGGPTPVHALRAGSPAIDAAGGVFSNGTDQRGVARAVGSITGGLLGRYYSTVTNASLLAPISNLEALTPADIAATPRIDFGAGTETVPGSGDIGSLLRDGSNGNPFGGIGVNVGQDNIAALWEGTITVPQTATYRFTTRSDDGSVLLIDGNPVVNNNFDQGMTDRNGTVVLTAGAHAIKVGWREGGGGCGMVASWEQLDGTAPFARVCIPPSVLSYTSSTPGIADIGAFEADDVLAPAGGTFTVLPGSPVKASGALLASFAGWTDASPLQYEVRDGANVIVPASANPSTPFTLPAGTYHLTGYVSDPYGNETTSGPITLVVDGQAPVLTVPSDIEIHATTQEQAVVNFTVSATDDLDPTPTVVASTPSGSTFPNGTTTVAVTATDDAGNVATASFHVTVTYDFVAYDKPFARDGEVPGAGELESGIEAEMLFVSFSSPAINSVGNIAMLAKKHIGNVKYNDITFHRGARDASSGLPTGKLLARVGGPVPGFSDVVWATLKDPQIAEDGSVLVLGTIKGTTPASAVLASEKTVLVWFPVKDGVEPQVVARTGQTLGIDGAKLKAILGMALVSDGVVAFTGSLTMGSGSPAVVPATDRAVVTWDAASGQLVTRVREGFSPGAGLPEVKNFKTLFAGSGTPGMGRGWLVSEPPSEGAGLAPAAAVARLRVQAALVDRTIVDLSIDLGTGLPTILFATGADGTELSGQPGVRLKSVGIFAAGNNDDIAVLRAAPSAGAQGLFAREAGAGTATSLVRAGDTAPGAGGALFKSFGDPIVAADGTGYAFLGKLAGTGVTSQSDSALYWGDAGASPQVLIAREGSVAPETGGAVFGAFKSVVTPGGGQGPILVAKLAIGPGGVTAANDLGLWAMDAQGNLRLLLREGVTNIGLKTVKSFATLATSAGNPGITRNFNGAGEVLAAVTFTDTTSAVVLITLPPAGQ